MYIEFLWIYLFILIILVWFSVNLSQFTFEPCIFYVQFVVKFVLLFFILLKGRKKIDWYLYSLIIIGRKGYGHVPQTRAATSALKILTILESLETLTWILASNSGSRELIILPNKILTKLRNCQNQPRSSRNMKVNIKV